MYSILKISKDLVSIIREYLLPINMKNKYNKNIMMNNDLIDNKISYVQTQAHYFRLRRKCTINNILKFKAVNDANTVLVIFNNNIKYNLFINIYNIPYNDNVIL